MTVTVMDIIDVVTVGDRFMPTSGPVVVLVVGMHHMGKVVLVVVPVMSAVGMTTVDVVQMVLVLNGDVAAGRPMPMGVIFVDGVLGAHGCSLLW